MAKLRFPGKALKLSSRKRVRFRGNDGGKTPEEAFTDLITKGFTLFQELFGDSDEADEDEFFGFELLESSTGSKHVPLNASKAKKLNEKICNKIDAEGLVTYKKFNSTAAAIGEVKGLEDQCVRQSKVTRNSTKQDLPIEDDPEINIPEKPGEEELEKDETVKDVDDISPNKGIVKQRNAPTVKTAIAKKLLAKAKKVPVTMNREKSPKRFVLPTMSVRSSRIIKPNRRLFSDITAICSTTKDKNSPKNCKYNTDEEVNTTAKPSKTKSNQVKFSEPILDLSCDQEEEELDDEVGKMSRTISLYADAITNQAKNPIGRPKKCENPLPIQENKVKEKIEKLLRSPWDDRLKHKSGKDDSEDHAAIHNKPIIRKARFNLNKKALQKIRNPPVSLEVSNSKTCAFCLKDNPSNIQKYGSMCCEDCQEFVDEICNAEREPLSCVNEDGNCSINIDPFSERCRACWLKKVLLASSLPSILHDSLRKTLPPFIKAGIPTSVARNTFTLQHQLVKSKNSSKSFLEDNNHFGTVIDLPGGWKRKMGAEIVVESPTGEEFNSIPMLEEYLLNQGILADAWVLFGAGSVKGTESLVKTKPTCQSNVNINESKIVSISLPGGWMRRIKWRPRGSKFDVYVHSPDGKTFRSRKELCAYFKEIGKVDDIHKYFPVPSMDKNSSNTDSGTDQKSDSSSEPDAKLKLFKKSKIKRLKSKMGNNFTTDVTRSFNSESSINFKITEENQPTQNIPEEDSSIPNRKTDKRLPLQKDEPTKMLTEKNSEPIEYVQAENNLSTSKITETNSLTEEQNITNTRTTEKGSLFSGKDNLTNALPPNKEKSDLTNENSSNLEETEKKNKSNLKIIHSSPLKITLAKDTRSDEPSTRESKKSEKVPKEITKTNHLNKEDKRTESSKLNSPKTLNIKDKEINLVLNSSTSPFSKKEKVKFKDSSGDESRKVPVASLNRIMRFPPTESESNGDSSDNDNKKVSFQKKIKTILPKSPNTNLFQNCSKISVDKENKDPPMLFNSALNNIASTNNQEKSIQAQEKKKAFANRKINELPEQEKENTRELSKRKRIPNRRFEQDYEMASSDDSSKNSKNKLPMKNDEKNDEEDKNNFINKKLLNSILEKKRKKKEMSLSSSDSDNPTVKKIQDKEPSISTPDPVKSDDNSDTDIFSKYKKLLKEEKPLTIPKLDETSDYSSVPSDTDNASDNSVAPVILVPSKDKVPEEAPIKISKFSTEKFGSGWSRKIRWNDAGEGEVASLCSPEGQKIVSRIELNAYFKKSGKPLEDIEFFFPKTIARPTNTVKVQRVKKLKEIPAKTPKEKVQDYYILELGEPINRPITELPINLNDKKVLVLMKKVGSKVIRTPIQLNELEQNGKLNLPPRTSWKQASSLANIIKAKLSRDVKVYLSSTIDEPIDTSNIPEGAGPRVKHVCRSQAQVLGMPRAVFPPPNEETEEPLPTPPPVPQKKSSKVVTITTTANGKVLRKVQWCNKCVGCTTPNCLVCVNCLDMKKYGGPGTKKKPCVLRKCLNPRIPSRLLEKEDFVWDRRKTKKEKQDLIALEPFTPEINLNSNQNEDDQYESKGVFVPKQITWNQDQKDRCDVQAGKNVAPGAMVNIDYCQDYELNDVCGYPLITTAPVDVNALCFRCGSAGKEELYFCARCCEGIHPYCLEDGEGPESDKEEKEWVCRRCALCNVCGSPGLDTLFRCSDCRQYYHIECLGPTSHVDCQPDPNRPWEVQVRTAVSDTWISQTPIYDSTNDKQDCDGIDLYNDWDVTYLDQYNDLDFNQINNLDEMYLHKIIDAIEVDLISDKSNLHRVYNTKDVDEILLTMKSDLLPRPEGELCEVDKSSTATNFVATGLADGKIYTDLIPLSPKEKGRLNKSMQLKTNELTSSIKMSDDEYLGLGYPVLRNYWSEHPEITLDDRLANLYDDIFEEAGFKIYKDAMQKGSRFEGLELSEPAFVENEDLEIDWKTVLSKRQLLVSIQDNIIAQERNEIDRMNRDHRKEIARLERLHKLKLREVTNLRNDIEEKQDRFNKIKRKRKRSSSSNGSVSKKMRIFLRKMKDNIDNSNMELVALELEEQDMKEKHEIASNIRPLTFNRKIDYSASKYKYFDETFAAESPAFLAFKARNVNFLLKKKVKPVFNNCTLSDYYGVVKRIAFNRLKKSVHLIEKSLSHQFIQNDCDNASKPADTPVNNVNNTPITQPQDNFATPDPTVVTPRVKRQYRSRKTGELLGQNRRRSVVKSVAIQPKKSLMLDNSQEAQDKVESTGFVTPNSLEVGANKSDYDVYNMFSENSSDINNKSMDESGNFNYEISTDEVNSSDKIKNVDVNRTTESDISIDPDLVTENTDSNTYSNKIKTKPCLVKLKRLNLTEVPDEFLFKKPFSPSISPLRIKRKKKDNQLPDTNTIILDCAEELTEISVEPSDFNDLDSMESYPIIDLDSHENQIIHDLSSEVFDTEVSGTAEDNSEVTVFMEEDNNDNFDLLIDPDDVDCSFIDTELDKLEANEVELEENEVSYENTSTNFSYESISYETETSLLDSPVDSPVSRYSLKSKRRSHGRPSEMASLRKALMDY